MQYQADALKQLLVGINEHNANQRPIPGKWSIAENIAHLGRYHEVFLERMQKVVHEQEPQFTRYIADNDPGFLEWSKLDLNTLLQQFHASRQLLHDYLFELSNKDLQKTGRHPLFGSWSITGWCEFFLLHESHHYFTILKLLPQLNIQQ